MNPEAIESIYEDLVTGVQSRVVKQLSIIKQACDKQVKFKNCNFSIAEIGRISESMDGPKIQTIRNGTENAAKYRKLISVYKIVYGSSSPLVGKKSDLFGAIQGVESAALRMQLMELYAENKRLKEQLRQSEMVDPIDVSLLDDQPVQAQLGEGLTPIEMNALKHFISKNNLEEHGWEIDVRGRIVNFEGVPITKQYFVNAVEKIATVS